MKKLVSAFMIFTTLTSFSQETEAPKDGWKIGGNVSFIFNQSAFNAEWLGGGTSNIAGNIAVSYDFNYKKEDWNWDNKLLLDYGLTKIKNDDFTKKTNDRLEFNSLLGKKAGKNWYYSAFLNFRTQITKGYEFATDIDGNQTRTEITHFLSPAYIQIGPGMLWKKNDNLKINIAPATARWILVDKAFTNGLPDGSYFGVDQGKSSRLEFGASLSGYAKLKLMDNVTMENILSLYSNYLEDPQNVDIDYTMNVVMTINKYLTTNLIFQAIYDDNAVGAFQIREMFV